MAKLPELKHTYIKLDAVQSELAEALFATYQLSGKHIPASASNSPLYGPIEDQGQHGSCTAFAVLQWLAYLIVLAGGTWVEFSESAEYDEERILLGTFPQDSGAFTTTALQVLEQRGAMYRSEFDYTDANLNSLPPEDKWIAHSQFAANHAQAITQQGDDLITAMKDAIANKLPILQGLVLYEEFESPQVAQTGVLIMPTATSKKVGGHEMIAVDYDDNMTHPNNPGLVGYAKYRNQWGLAWGQQGYVWIPYAYLKNQDNLIQAPIVGFPTNYAGALPEPPVDDYTISVKFDKASYNMNEQANVTVTTLKGEQPYNTGMNNDPTLEFTINGQSESGECPTIQNGQGGIAWGPPSNPCEVIASVHWVDPYGTTLVATDNANWGDVKPVNNTVYSLEVTFDADSAKIGTYNNITVTTLADGKPLESQALNIQIVRPNGSYQPTGSTGADGTFRIPLISMTAGTITVNISWTDPSSQVHTDSKSATWETPVQPNQKLYHVQVGAFADKTNADNLLAKVKSAGFTDAFIKYE